MTSLPTPRAVAVYILIHSPSTSLQSEPNFLVVSSRKHKGKFVLPKGGIEDEDDNEQDAAEREAWEEAGVIPGQLHLSTLCLIPDTLPHPKSPSPLPSSSNFIPCTTYSIQLFTTTSNKISEILSTESDWPERLEREERKFVKGFKELEEAICWGRKEDLWRGVLEILKARLT